MATEAVLYNAVLETARLFGQQPPASRAEVVEAVAHMGLSVVELNFLISLVPSAYARRHYRDDDVHFSDKVAIVFPDNSYIEKYLTEIPVYMVARRIADGASPEQRAAVAMLSAEYAIIQQTSAADLATNTISIAMKSDGVAIAPEGS